MPDIDSSSEHDVHIFTACPQSKDVDGRDYVQRIIDISQWSEDFNCDGILIYTDNGLVDPWLVAQVVVENTKRLMPLVAVQPIYLHPYSVAKLAASIAYLHGRRIALNMLAGGFRNDLIALGDTTEHDDRYLRLTEYTQIIRRLLESDGAVELAGKYYSVKNLKLAPPLPPKLFPEILISRSSEAGMACASAIGATAIRYPQPPECESAEREAVATGIKLGVRVGIIAREDNEEAWHTAHERFPTDRRGQLAHQLAMKVSDSVWHKQLSELSERPASADNPYWLSPMQNYKTFCRRRRARALHLARAPHGHPRYPSKPRRTSSCNGGLPHRMRAGGLSLVWPLPGAFPGPLLRNFSPPGKV
jgi:alkanesulfonate monooxygenase